MASRPELQEAAQQGLPSMWRETLLRLGQEPELLTLAHTLAQIPPELAPDDREGLALLALLALLAAKEGHTRLPLTGPGSDETQARLALFGGPEATLSALLARPGLALAITTPGNTGTPFIRTEDWLASARLYAAEQRLATALHRTLTHGPSGCFHADLPLPDFSDLLEAPVSLSGEQRQAVAQAVAGPLALITGGPGSGKTSIVVAILRAALRAGLAPEEIALAAPTGKAAQRITESLHGTLQRIGPQEDADMRLLAALPEAQTLHRLLAFLPSRQAFRHHRNNPLPHRLVVVDESSMIGLDLMDGLLQALGPDTRLVLLGDAEQLPSVDPGAVFRDLVAALPGAAIHLSHSYRMDAADPAGRSVLLTARAIRAGDQTAMDAPEALVTHGSCADLSGRGAEHVEVDDPQLKTFLKAYLEAEVLAQPGFHEASQRVVRHEGGAWSEGDEAALDVLFRTHERIRLLCPLREVPALRSTEGLNLALHRLVRKEAGQALDRDLAVYAGEPVMINANDYQRGLYNGDQGVVVKAHLDGAVHQAVAFRTANGFRLLPYRPLQPQLELAWALTVHKSQGSEFDRVVLVLPPPDSPLLTQEILYTALTRARFAATMLGSRASLEAALSQTSMRYTGLKEALATAR